MDCSVPQESVLGPLKFIEYRGLAELINSHHLSYHLYADDTQVIASTRTTHAELTADHLQQCVGEIHRWCSSRRLQLNPHKTKFIWFGSRTNLQNLTTLWNLTALPGTSSLTVTHDVVQSVNAVLDLGVTLDSELSMQNHANKVARTCFYHIRRLKQVRKLLGPDVAANSLRHWCSVDLTIVMQY